MEEIKPVFIGGCPRSGTTFLGSILGASKDSIATPESQFKIDLGRIFALDKKNNEKEIRRCLKNNWRFKIWNINDYASKTDIQFINNKELLLDIVLYYSLKNYSKIPKFWIDHTPSNIRFGEKITKDFPEAKFIHLVRDARAVYSSVKKLDWGPNTPKVAAKWWLENIAYGLALEKYLPSNQFLQVKFEDLLLNTKDEVNKICNFIDCEFEEEMLFGKGFIIPNYTKNQHRSIGDKPLLKVKDKWKKELTKREVELIELYTDDMLIYFDYTIINIRKNKIRKFENIKFYIVEFFNKYIINRILYVKRKLNLK